jgi:hypothetical protein
MSSYARVVDSGTNDGLPWPSPAAVVDRRDVQADASGCTSEPSFPPRGPQADGPEVLADRLQR